MVFNAVPNRRFAIVILVLATHFIFPTILTTVCRSREMDVFASSVNEAPLLMTVSMGFSSISS